MSYSKSVLLASVAVVQLIAAAQVRAQDTASGPAAESEHSDTVITVTAFKREQDIQDVPAAISAVSGEALSSRGISEAADLQFITPSLQVGESQGNTAFTIRGVGFNTVGSPAVAVHVDGVFQPRPGQGDLAQIDVERVEILRGPQGTLYGRNANGGVINFISRRPTNDFEGSFKASYASYDEITLEGIVNVPISDQVGARLVVSHNDQRQGFVNNVAGGPDLLDEGHEAVRLALDFEVTDDVTVELTGSYVEQDGAVYPSIAQTTPFTTGARGAPFGDLFAFQGDLYRALGALHSTEHHTTTANDPSSSDREAVTLSGVIDWDLGGGINLRSTTGYQEFSADYRSDFDGTNVTIYQGKIIRDSSTFTQEVAFSGSAGPVDFVVGGFFMDESYSQDLSITEPNGNGSFLPGALLSFVTPYYDTQAVAIFSDLTWNVSDSLRVIGGLRYSEDQQNTFQQFDIFAQIKINPTTTISLGNQCSAALPELNFSSTTPRFGLQYDVSDDSTVYANYAEGQKVGGYNTDGTCNDAYLPEEIKSYELGWRNSLLDGDLTLNATGFFYDYTNLQLQQIIGTGVSILNAPRAEILGLELEGNYRASSDLSVFGSLSLLDATYKEFSVFDGAANAQIDAAGNRLNSAPKVSVNAGFEYSPNFEVAEGGLTLRTDASFRSATFLRESNSPQERQGAYTVVNASLTWASADDRLAIRGFVTNLLDEVYLTQSQWSAPINSRTISWGNPRQYGVEMLVNF